MCKVMLRQDEKQPKQFVAKDENLSQILEFFHIDIDKNNIYINGKLITKERMHIQMPQNGLVYLVVRRKSISR